MFRGIVKTVAAVVTAFFLGAWVAFQLMSAGVQYQVALFFGIMVGVVLAILVSELGDRI